MFSSTRVPGCCSTIADSKVRHAMTDSLGPDKNNVEDTLESLK